MPVPVPISRFIPTKEYCSHAKFFIFIFFFLKGFLLDKKIGVNQPKRMENVNILIANTGMDTDKIKV